MQSLRIQLMFVSAVVAQPELTARPLVNIPHRARYHGQPITAIMCLPWPWIRRGMYIQAVAYRAALQHENIIAQALNSGPRITVRLSTALLLTILEMSIRAVHRMEATRCANIIAQALCNGRLTILKQTALLRLALMDISTFAGLVISRNTILAEQK